MAMEIRREIKGPDGGAAHDGQILCVAYNPLRREIFTGSQDTTIKTWLSETGEFVRTLQEHKGWVTGLAFAPELRVLFSCSIDGRVLVWSKAELLQKENVGSGKGDSAQMTGSVKGGPLHCLAWDARRHNLVVGANGHIWVYSAISETEMTPTTKNVIKLQSLLKDAHTARGPEDALVRGIICTDSGKLFSVGYDRQLCMWDTDSTRALAPKKKPKKGDGDGSKLFGDAPQLRRVGTPIMCHDAAISAVAFDSDNNNVITGSFDRQVKVWATGDGKKPVAVIDEKTGIDDTITGLAYCNATKTLWISSNSATPIVYDPRSATDITPFLQPTDTSTSAQKNAKDRIQKLFRIPQTGELYASTSARNLLIWRYNPHAASTILRAHTDWVEVLAHCYKRKPLPQGAEAEAAAQFLPPGEEDTMVLLSGGADSVIRRWEPASRMNPFIYSQADALPGHSGAVLCALYCPEVDMFATGGDDGIVRLWPLGKEVDPSLVEDEDEDEGAGKGGGGQQQGPWELGTTAPDGPGHSERVTGLICFGATIGSVSWDLSLRLWDVKQAMREMREGEDAKPTHVILDAHDDYILSVAHSPELGQIATSSADQGVKLWDVHRDTEPTPQSLGGTRDPSPQMDEFVPREMSVPEGRKGKALCGTLTGHAADVSHVKWNPVHRLWVSGSEDRSVRLWSSECVQVGEIRPPGDTAVTGLAIDKRGFILVASMDRAVRVYDPRPARSPDAARKYDPEVVQQHLGHSDAVRCIVHVPEKQQYITASWDRTVRVWRDYQPPKVEAIEEGEGEEGEEGEAAAEAPEAAVAAAAEEEEEEEEEFVPYAVLHPLIEPKCLADRQKGSGGDKFMRKVTDGDGKDRRKKKGADEDTSIKSGGKLALELNRMEERHRVEFRTEQAGPAAAAGTDRRSVRGRLSQNPRGARTLAK